jgi:hypothetical protein
MAEEVGFEPTRPCDLAVFKTASLNHSDTPPNRCESNSNMKAGDPSSQLQRPLSGTSLRIIQRSAVEAPIDGFFAVCAQAPPGCEHPPAILLSTDPVRSHIGLERLRYRHAAILVLVVL